MKNNRGQQKYAYGFRGGNHAKWTSKYGSVTFNQIGKEFPYGGINEKGLAVEQLWLTESYYQDNKNSVISELEWIQYQLDNYSSVAEVLENLNSLTIKPIATIHYFIADQSGQSAVIDFIEGKAEVSKKEGKNQVITNEIFSRSEKYYVLYNDKVDPASRTNYDRYCQIKSSLSQYNVESAEKAFEILGRSAEDRDNYKTFWSIVYDLTNMEVHYKSYENTTIKKFRIQDFNFSPETPIQSCAMNSSTFNLENYTFEMNENLLSTSMKMMDITLDLPLAANHQMNPGESRIDSIFKSNYSDVSVVFLTKKPSGYLHFAVMLGEENFKFKKAIKGASYHIYNTENKRMIYNLPKEEFVIACYLDSNRDGKMDKSLIGIPKNYGFTRNKRGFFGTPPKYKDAFIDLKEDLSIAIEIK